MAEWNPQHPAPAKSARRAGTTAPGGHSERHATGLPGLVRISFGCYNTLEEVDHAAEILARISAGDVAGEYDQDPVSRAYSPQGYQPDYERYFVLQPGLKLHPHMLRLPRCGV